MILQNGQTVLLGRRARGQYKGAWCIPCGHLERGEEVRPAARREFLEETGLQAEVGPVCAVHSNFHAPKSLTVGIWFRGSVIGGGLQAADELDAADHFPLNALPEYLAFPTDKSGLQQLRQEFCYPAARGLRQGRSIRHRLVRCHRPFSRLSR